MSLKSKDRERAVYAYESVKKFRDRYNTENKSKAEEAENNFKSYAKSILSYIQLNGLVAAFAFVETKKDKGDNKSNKDASTQAYEGLYRITQEWIKKIYGLKDDSDILYISYYFARLDSEQYRAVRNEIIKLFSWIRRYAES